MSVEAFKFGETQGMKVMHTQVSELVYFRFLGFLVFLLTAILGFHGCIMISAVEHRIKVNPDGSGIAVITFLDFRSDAVDDSVYAEDFNLLLDVLAEETIKEFETDGKKILRKELYLSGDSLSLRVEYEFRSLRSIEGIRLSNDEIFFMVDEWRQILRTNGVVENESWGGKRMVWKAGTRQLSYLVEDVVPLKGRSLSQAYRLHLQESGQ